MTALLHPVVIGHTEFVPSVVAPFTFCAICTWERENDHTCQDGIEHAGELGHLVVVAGCGAMTVIVLAPNPPCTRLRASDGGVCGNDEERVCTALHLDEVTS